MSPARAVAIASLLFAAFQAAAQTPGPLRIGIVGLTHGHVAGFFDNNLQRTDIQIVGIAEPDRRLFDRYSLQHRLDPALYFASLGDMIARVHPSAVVVYTNTFDHRRVVEECARHGIHVMMEKPLAVSYRDALAMADAARNGNIHVLVNYETTWYASNKAAHDLLQEGALGEVRKVVVHDGHRGPKEIHVQPEFFAWLTDPKLNGAGALFDFGCYGADLMTWLVSGEPPQTVTAVTQHFQPEIYPRVDDEATVILTYPRAVAILQASWNWPFDRKDMEVYGRTGSVKTILRDRIEVRREGEKEAHIQTPPRLEPPDDDSLHYFASVINGQVQDANNLSSLKTNLVVTEILDAARRSAATGRTVTLPLEP
ncbi:MAG TPA: Gfo/Idh/MocA family oxidoreductase [Bryobacteraceae bacterium]|jgi:predicted dehydrogenase|nr:Gfo/Idh/MocA family oxidoreductase [Bryobacteraceae bacterium]